MSIYRCGRSVVEWVLSKFWAVERSVGSVGEGLEGEIVERLLERVVESWVGRKWRAVWGKKPVVDFVCLWSV